MDKNKTSVKLSTYLSSLKEEKPSPVVAEEDSFFQLPFRNCEKHCWCQYEGIDASSLVFKNALKVIEHDHGPEGDWCTGCLIEAGKVTF